MSSSSGTKVFERSQEPTPASAEKVAQLSRQYVLPVAKSFAQQYAGLYYARLRQIRPALLARIKDVVSREERKGIVLLMNR